MNPAPPWPRPNPRGRRKRRDEPRRWPSGGILGWLFGDDE